MTGDLWTFFPLKDWPSLCLACLYILIVCTGSISILVKHNASWYVKARYTGGTLSTRSVSTTGKVSQTWCSNPVHIGILCICAYILHSWNHDYLFHHFFSNNELPGKIVAYHCLPLTTMKTVPLVVWGVRVETATSWHSGCSRTAYKSEYHKPGPLLCVLGVGIVMARQCIVLNILLIVQ